MSESAIITLILLALGVPIALLAILLISVASLSRRVRALETGAKREPSPSARFAPELAADPGGTTRPSRAGRRNRRVNAIGAATDSSGYVSGAHSG